jgi:hypothetical protein
MTSDKRKQQTGKTEGKGQDEQDAERGNNEEVRSFYWTLGDSGDWRRWM